MQKQISYVSRKTKKTYSVEFDYENCGMEDYNFSGNKLPVIDNLTIYDEDTGLEVTQETDNRVFNEVNSFVLTSDLNNESDCE